jgi:hypothetical protein
VISLRLTNELTVRVQREKEPRTNLLPLLGGQIPYEGRTPATLPQISNSTRPQPTRGLPRINYGLGGLCSLMLEFLMSQESIISCLKRH